MYSFLLASSWYGIPRAFLLCLLLAVVVFVLFYWWISQKLARQREELTANKMEHQRELAEAKELAKQHALLENGVGETKRQLRKKTIALAKKSKESDAKGRILLALKELTDEVDEEGVPSRFQWAKLRRILANYSMVEDDSFSLQLEELHQDFIVRLSEQFPQLTTYDLRLCIYLKSGLKTREIAQQMNVLPSSVNVSRSRLRKKLQLKAKEDLYKFLKSLE